MSAQDPFGNTPDDPTQPQQRFTGRKLLADALKNFVFSLGQGMAASAQYPGRRGSQAGMAAALQGPMLLQQIEQKQRQEAEDRRIKLEQFRQQVGQNRMQQAMQTLNAAQDRYKMLEGTPGQVVPDPDPLGGTKVLPHPAVQFPAIGNQPAYAMTPRTSQEIDAPKERAAQAAQVGAYNQTQGLINAVQANPELLKILPESVVAQVTGQLGPKTPTPPIKTPNLSNRQRDTQIYQGKPTDVLIDADPASPTVGHVFLLGGEDVTGKTSHYEKPYKPPDQAGRTERSFNSRSSELDKVGQPVLDAVARLGRLKDTIENGSPLADSLTAPELMVVMAGGAGSGVRITQGEINNVMGGQSRWEAMRAALNQWNTDPAKANKILEPMRGQIRQLLGTVSQKLANKEAIVEDARQKLIDTDDPKAHRQIVADAKKALAAVDTGGAVNAPASDVVKIQAKDGTIGTIPRAKLPEAIKRGAKVMP